jgi:hypothetical protein
MQLEDTIEGYEKCMESLVKQILKNQKCGNWHQNNRWTQVIEQTWFISLVVW